MGLALASHVAKVVRDCLEACSYLSAGGDLVVGVGV